MVTKPGATELTSIDEVLEAGRIAQAAGHWDEAVAIYQAALDQWESVGGAQTCDLLRKIGLVHYHRGDLDVALNLFMSSRRIASEGGLVPQIAHATNCVAIVHQARGQLEAARDLYLTAQALAVQCGNETLVSKIDQNLGIIACIQGRTEEALQRFRSALARRGAAGDHAGAGRVLNNIGMVQVDLKAWAEAEMAYDQALVESELADDIENVATIQLNRSELYVSLGRYDDARACCDQAFEIFSRIESKSGLGDTYRAYGVLYRESGKLHLAEAHLALVTDLARAAENPLLEAEAEADFALVHLAQGRNREALKSLNRAHRLFGELHAQRDLVDVERRLDRLEDTYLQVVAAWGESIESADRYTAGHCRRVADYTCRLARAVGLEGRELTWIRMGAFLHDVGKTAVSPDVLNKPGVLDLPEWEEMRRHTTAGDQIVAELGFPYDIRPMVRSHHERWDGAGYPDHLAGQQIALNARMLCIADVYDALTTTRSYRPAFSREHALEMMRSEAGGSFDPELLHLFIRILSEDDAGPPAGPVSGGVQA